MSLRIIWNDITKVKADVVVTPASREPRIGRGLDAAIHDAAGKQLEAWRCTMGTISPGVVHVSPSYNLAASTGARHIIHALGPAWSARHVGTIMPALDDTYLRILLAAKKISDCETVSIPVLSSGKFGMPIAKAMAAAVNAITAFLDVVPDLTVQLVGIDSDFHDVALKSYGKYYVETGYSPKDEQAYRKVHPHRGRRNNQASTFTTDEHDPYFQEIAFDEVMSGTTFKEAFRKLWDIAVVSWEREHGKMSVNPYKGVKAFSFLTGIAPGTIKNYRTDRSGAASTSKDKVFAICVALRLPLNYAEALLKKCHYAFNPRDQRERLVRTYIEGRGGSVKELNAQLAGKNLAPLDTHREDRGASSSSSPKKEVNAVKSIRETP